MIMLLSGCKHAGLIFEPPSTLKAVVQGEFRGMAIHCEKTLTLGNARWEVMCKVSDEIDIKYRTQTIDKEQTRLEIMIDKQSDDHIKTIVAPTMIVSANRPAMLETEIEKDRIAISTEPIR